MFPTPEMNNLDNFDEEFPFAKQIEVYEDSSFLLTESGSLYSWGSNDNGFLGREVKLDMKQFGAGEKKKSLAFSTKTPGRVDKLGNTELKRIKIVNGRFLGFLADEMDAE